MESAAAHATNESIADRLAALAGGSGTAAHRFPAHIVALPRESARDLADAVHHLCLLHGSVPGLADIVAERTAEPAARDWMRRAVEGFARERGFLTRLVVAAGPLPSTPGQAQCEAAVLGQRHALEMLASSDRNGCGLGAAAGLILDWRAIRHVLSAAADRLGVEAPLISLPDEHETLTTIVAVAQSPAVERAILFGADQLLHQHRGHWDLLEARSAARGDS